MPQYPEILQVLVQHSSTVDLSGLTPYGPLLVTRQASGEPLPPYLLHVGPEYDKHRILIYATAQNLLRNDELIVEYRMDSENGMYRLYGGHQSAYKMPPSCCDYHQVPIQQYSDGVLLALAGLLVYRICGAFLPFLDEIHNHMSVTDYYKFSLYDNKDINPNCSTIAGIPALSYWQINDCLSAIEMTTLTPRFVLSLGGRQYARLKEHRPTVLKVNDPSWIKRGAGGHLSPPGGSWHIRAQLVRDEKVKDLVDGYLDQLSPIYQQKREQVRAYLKKSFLDFGCSLSLWEPE